MDPQSGQTRTISNPSEIVKEQYEHAVVSLHPTSRRKLALTLQAKTGMPYKDAFAVVDTYCDQEALTVPTYLRSEFGVFWLKVVAVFWVVVGLALLLYARGLHLAHIYPWEIWVAGTLCFGVAALCWVKSLQNEKVLRPEE